MADVSKAQKLAAARKRLKQYQKFQSKQKNVRTSDDDETAQNANLATVSSGNATPADSMTSSTHSASEHAAVVAPPSASQETEPLPAETSASPFNKALFQQPAPDNSHILSNYFDTIVHTCEARRDGQVQGVDYADPFEQTPVVRRASTESKQTEHSQNDDVPADSRTRSESAWPETMLHQHARSNTESLRQLSSQLNSLMGSTEAPGPGHELEHRNQELAALLQTERTRSDELSLQVREYVTRIARLEAECVQVRTEHEAQLSRAVGPLQEQLDYHTKACGILVGERTELQLELAQSQATGKQRAGEAQELQGRLKASRHRVAELEQELAQLRAARDGEERADREAGREAERLRLEGNLLRAQLDEATEESAELKAKLNVKAAECLGLHTELQDTRAQLARTQLKVQQLTMTGGDGGDGGQADAQLEILHQRRVQLEQQVAELTHAVTAAGQERDQASHQCQQYVQQLNGQIQALADRLAACSGQHEALAAREQSLVRHVGELETRLQQAQAEPAEDSVAVQRLEQQLQHAREERAGCEKEQHAEREALEHALAEKSALIERLESRVEVLQDQPDAGKLLATMESDKVAAARAVEQNQKLKGQLEELHEGFIKMSNSKLELTESLQTEQHRTRELGEQLAQSSAAVEHLHTVIASKDAQLTETHAHTTGLQKQLIQQSQLADRLRHYEAQDHASEHVQQELQQAQRTVLKLTADNESLRTEIDRAKGGAVDGQLTEEPAGDGGGAMGQLEERFKQTMVEVANLTEEKHRLEHLVLQLQGETETIGEYVTLYQCQRAVLNEKALEKDEQLGRLARDREDMKHKLDQLNMLVQRLVLDHGIVSHDVLARLHHAACQVAPERPVNGADTHDNNNVDNGTAGKIIALLSEIKTSNLVQPGDTIQNFHPCPLCSGQLITV